VTVTANVTLVGIILHDRINVLVVVTVPAALAVFLRVFFMSEFYRAGVDEPPPSAAPLK
jgi:hypothetical protein